MLKSIKSYTNGWVAAISFARVVSGGKEIAGSAIAMAANNCTLKKRRFILHLSKFL